MPRGRPTRSEIRNNIIEILAVMGSGYGYDIYKAYRIIFPKVTLRSIYYHLKKGVQLDEFTVAKIEKSQGDYSWGPEAEKIFYALGKNAKPSGNVLVKEYFERKGTKGDEVQ